MDKTIIIGNLGGDAEAKTTENGKDYVRFTVAVAKEWKNEAGEQVKRTNWIECTYWNRGQTLAQYLLKGTKVMVEGEAGARAYTNNEGEVKASRTLNVREFEFLSRKADNKPAEQKEQQPKPDNSADNYTPEADDLPF